MNYDVVRARKTNRVGRIGRYEAREGKREACRGSGGQKSAIRNDTRRRGRKKGQSSLNERTPDNDCDDDCDDDDYDDDE